MKHSCSQRGNSNEEVTTRRLASSGRLKANRMAARSRPGATPYRNYRYICQCTDFAGVRICVEKSLAWANHCDVPVCAAGRRGWGGYYICRKVTCWHDSDPLGASNPDLSFRPELDWSMWLGSLRWRSYNPPDHIGKSLRGGPLQTKAAAGCHDPESTRAGQPSDRQRGSLEICIFQGGGHQDPIILWQGASESVQLHAIRREIPFRRGQPYTLKKHLATSPINCPSKCFRRPPSSAIGRSATLNTCGQSFEASYPIWASLGSSQPQTMNASSESTPATPLAQVTTSTVTSVEIPEK